jgi:alpha-tubulin suppressor-like RCC1 family protein
MMSVPGVPTSEMPISAIGIAVGSSHGCAVTPEHHVMCWGANFSKQLGNGDTAASHLAVFVTGIGYDLEKIDQISAWGDFTCAHSMAGSVWCWGSGGDGELGNNAYKDFANPQQVTEIAHAPAVVAGGGHACAVTDAMTAECWGASYVGQIGDGLYGSSPTPRAIPGLSGIRELALGEQHSCAVVGDGRVLCWGDGRQGQLGNGIARQSPRAPLLPCP